MKKLAAGILAVTLVITVGTVSVFDWAPALWTTTRRYMR